MLGFGPVGQIPVAGSPPSEVVSYNFDLSSGVLSIWGRDVNLQVNFPLDAVSGVWAINGSPMHGVVDYVFGLESSDYWLLGKPARIFVSVFSYTDTEMIRVPTEVRMMYVPYEHRMMSVKGVRDAALVDGDDPMTVPPRLRRT